MFSVRFPLSWGQGVTSQLCLTVCNILWAKAMEQGIFSKFLIFIRIKSLYSKYSHRVQTLCGIYKGGKPIKLVTQIFHCGKSWTFSCHGSAQGFSEYSLLFADPKSRQGWPVLSFHVKVQEGKVEILSSPSSPGTFVLSSLESHIKDLQRRGYQCCSFAPFLIK